MDYLYLNDLYKDEKKYLGKTIKLKGWIKNHRKQKNFGFIYFSDGTAFRQLQLVYDNTLPNFEDIQKFHISSAVEVEGKLIESQGKGQDYEVSVTDIKLHGDCPEDYPIQQKKHSMEFLREQSYLRLRTNTFQAVFRIRSVASMAIHKYFQDRGYIYADTPIFTSSDCEGAGEMFQVTTQDLEKIAKEGKTNNEDEYFGQPVGLTVSGQFEGEAFAQAFSKIYTFGPTFRADPSHTPLHIAEFWQIEPEVAFCDLNGIMDISEELMKYVIKYTLENCPDELAFLDKTKEEGLVDKLNKVIESDFVRVTYKECIDILKKAEVEFEFKPEYGEDLAKEHERFITEHFKCPVFITYWPEKVKKCFYMKQMEDGTVANADLEMPGIGETYGMSQREDDFDKLERRIEELGMNKEEYTWYMNLRKYGTTVHSGFGMGFERLIMYMTGMDNIRDVSAFPRTPGNCLY
ncbi:MAG: asparagine--tRNA ligase [Bacilli bacterium]|nr:asparagine--tRNA ligase [Bacilli bacterium]